MIKNAVIAMLLVLVLILGYYLDTTQKQLRSVEASFWSLNQSFTTCMQAQAELQRRYDSVAAEYEDVFQRMVELSRQVGSAGTQPAPAPFMPGGSILGGLAGRFLGLP